MQVHADSSGLHYEERCAACQAASRVRICEYNLERAQEKHDEALVRQQRTLKKRKASDWTPPAPRLVMKHAYGRSRYRRRFGRGGEVLSQEEYKALSGYEPDDYEGVPYSLCGQRIGRSYEDDEVTCPKCLR